MKHRRIGLYLGLNKNCGKFRDVWHDGERKPYRLFAGGYGKSRNTAMAALRPLMPMTDPPGWVHAPQR